MTLPPLIGEGDALFLDLDGTLAPIESTPAGVGPSRRRNRLVQAVGRRLGGAMAVLSGRTIEEVDRILGLSSGPVGAVHGLVRRAASGALVEPEPSAELATARGLLEPLAQGRPGVLLEDKRHALAVHYRQAPPAREAVRAACARISTLTGLVLQEGHMVCELRTPGPTKGDALRAFMGEPPFEGRRPIMVGDDLTDEHAFAAAAAFGGFGVLVGAPRPTAARHRLENVQAVLDWLARSLEGGRA